MLLTITRQLPFIQSLTSFSRESHKDAASSIVTLFAKRC